MPPDCRHSPACPKLSTRFVCSQRTNAEDAVKRGLISRPSAEKLMAKYGVTLTPISLVYKGAAPGRREPVTESLWTNEE